MHTHQDALAIDTLMEMITGVTQLIYVKDPSQVLMI